jgi:hypothetical protein
MFCERNAISLIESSAESGRAVSGPAPAGIRSHGCSSSSNCTKSRRAAGTHPLVRLRAGPHSITLTPAGPATRAGNRRHFKSSNRADWPALTLVAGAGPQSLATTGPHLFRIAPAGQHCLRVSPGHDRAAPSGCSCRAAAAARRSG